MPTLQKPKKDSRLDLRMTDEQRKQIDLAASINGVSVSQWCLNRLLDSARHDISEQKVMRLSTEAFESFASLLEQEPDPTFEAFRKEQTIWEA